MSMWLSLAGLAALGFLAWNLVRLFGSKRLSLLNEQRRASSNLVGRAEFVDGNRRLPVALAVSDSTLFYENASMQASLDLEWVREIEYDSGLATGGEITSGKVLRLRSDSQTFEFVLPEAIVSRWSEVLPPRAGV